ncbi:MAG: arylamine N-acetyltransferase [Thermoanaerobaculia bacterium]
MIPVDEILEALDLSRAQPGSGFLEALFARFNAKVPFENASKIVRDAKTASPEEKPRTPHVFWSEHLERGAGGTCFARVAAFQALLDGLGFQTRKLLGRVESDEDHAALLISTPAGETIADVGFPLPALLPARAGRVETAVTDLEASPTPRGLRVAFSGGMPEGPREIEIFFDPVTDERYRTLWRGTFRPGARFLESVGLRKDAGNRTVSFARGTLRVDDRHSRLELPLLADRAAALSEVFGIDAELLGEALTIAGDPAPAGTEATLTAYLETDRTASEAYSAIATPEGYRKLLEGVAEVVAEERTASGFRLELGAPGGGDASPRLSEEVVAEESRLRLSILRKTPAAEFRSSFRAETRGGSTWLLREAALSGSREDLLRNDALRGRLAGTLAVDLLAWARLL